MSWLHKVIVTVISAILCTSVRASVINYWRFEEGSGSLVADSTGLADGVLDPYFPTTAGAGDSGELGWSTNTPFSIVPQTQAANLGSLHFAPGPGVTLSPTAPMNYGSNFTVEFFFNLDTLPVVRSPYFLLNFFDTTTVAQIRLAIFQDRNGFNFQVLASTAHGGAFFNTPPLSLSPQTWYHFALVNSSGHYEVFLNGTSAGTPVSGGGGAFVFGTSGHYFIGTDNFSGGFDGFLDEIRISDEALAPSQFLNAIPEPSTFVLTTLAIGIVMAFRKGCRHEAAD